MIYIAPTSGKKQGGGDIYYLCWLLLDVFFRNRLH